MDLGCAAGSPCLCSSSCSSQPCPRPSIANLCMVRPNLRRAPATAPARRIAASPGRIPTTLRLLGAVYMHLAARPGVTAQSAGPTIPCGRRAVCREDPRRLAEVGPTPADRVSHQLPHRAPLSSCQSSRRTRSSRAAKPSGAVLAAPPQRSNPWSVDQEKYSPPD